MEIIARSATSDEVRCREPNARKRAGATMVPRTRHRSRKHTPRTSIHTDRHLRWTGRPGGFGGGARTRSLPELGRENPQRPWYCVLRHGRVGRRQVFQSIPERYTKHKHIAHAGWSSPVARQAHNLKVTGSNPVPATKISPLNQRFSGFFVVQILGPKK